MSNLINLDDDDKPSRKPMSQEHQEMLDELLDKDEGLSGWAIEFIDSLDHQRDRELTDKQADKLKELWERHC